MFKTTRKRDQSGSVALLFLGPDAPPLDGEASCCCHHLEGLHRTDGSCSAVGCRCSWFVELDDCEEPTRPDIAVEYDPGCEPEPRCVEHEGIRFLVKDANDPLTPVELAVLTGVARAASRSVR